MAPLPRVELAGTGPPYGVPWTEESTGFRSVGRDLLRIVSNQMA